MGVEQYRALFVAESEEHLQIINNSVLILEKDPKNADILNEIFRSAHTLKGMSATTRAFFRPLTTAPVCAIIISIVTGKVESNP